MADGPDDWDNAFERELLGPLASAGATRTERATPGDPDDRCEASRVFALGVHATAMQRFWKSNPDELTDIFDQLNWLNQLRTRQLETHLLEAHLLEAHLLEAHQLEAHQLVSATPGTLPWYARVSPQRLTGIAVFLAGRKRAALGCEWRSHLSGETGAGLPHDRQVREAAGFLLAALRYRLRDAADFAWQPVDALLASRDLSNLWVLLATLSVVVVFIRHGGLYELADNLGSVAVIWGAAFGGIHVGRKWRGVKPPKHEPRRKRQQ
jgi:hypothetical protein